MPLPSATSACARLFEAVIRHVDLLLAREGAFQIFSAASRGSSRGVQRRGVEQEVLPRADRQADPARRQHAEDVAVREQRDVARTSRTRAITRSTRAPTVRRLAARTAVAEDQPAGRALADLRGVRPSYRRSPTRRVGSIAARSPRPASSQVSRARRSGLVSTRRTIVGEHRAPSRARPARPSRSAGCRSAGVAPDRLHSVSPWRTT